VKKIWTPSWALFCSGWTLWILSGFYCLVDILGYKKWTFPFVVVGVNCTAMYLMWQMFKGWVSQSIRTHFGTALFETAYGPIWASLAWTLVLWLICLWMYRRKIFLKV
jgi:predicted acyltransferase